MRKYLLLTLAACFIFQFQTASADAMEFMHDWDAALAKAKKENKFVFLDAYATWCGPCKWMAAKVMTQDEVGDFYNKNFVSVKLDMEKGVGIEVAKRYNIGAYPTLGFFDGDGRMIWRAAGALPAEEFIALGQKVLDGVEPVQDMYDQYATGEYSKDFLYKYLVHMQESGMSFGEALGEYAEEMDDEELMTDQGWDVFYRFFQRIDSDKFKYFEKHMDEIKEARGEELVEKKYYDMHLSAYSRAIYQKDAAQVKAIQKKIEGKGGEEFQWKYLDMTFKWIKQSESKEDAYQALTEWVREGKPMHWSTLNEQAWNVYENEDDPAFLDMALAWVGASVEMERNFYNLDTQAMLYHKGGNLDRAIEVAQEAIAMAKEAGEDYGPTQEALDKMMKEKEGK